MGSGEFGDQPCRNTATTTSAIAAPNSTMPFATSAANNPGASGTAASPTAARAASKAGASAHVSASGRSVVVLVLRAVAAPQRNGALKASSGRTSSPVSYTHLRAHETRHDLVCRLLL